MGLKRLHISLSATQFRVLEKLALKLGLDKSSTISYCLARVAEQEALGPGRTDAPASRK